MFLSTLGKVIGRSGQHASHSLQVLNPVISRKLFYPTALPPSPEAANSRDFPDESRAHISPQQFEAVRHPTVAEETLKDSFHGLIDPRSIESKTRALLGQTPETRWANMAARFLDQVPPDAYAGRTIEVKLGDLHGAWAKLNAIIRQNNIRTELRLTARHEKKGAKRRRLRSERWRRKFGDEVRKKVELAIEIRNRNRLWGSR